jgi:16S rRNA G966 N2-methylase RsmD
VTSQELAAIFEPTIQLVHGDNLEFLQQLVSSLGDKIAFVPPITLVYMDPPFATGRTLTGAAGSFADRDSLAMHLEALHQRCLLACKLLCCWGSLVLHLDPKTSHYAKVMLDEVFGRECFASEIIWRYRRWPSKTQNFQRIHDVLLRYVVEPGKARWNQLYESPAASTLKTWGTGKQLALTDENGRRTRSSTTDESSPGVPMGDVWDIGIVAPVAKERTGYPTQKPEALYERLVLACTNEKDTVIDLYCGSGTMPAVCKRLGRTCISVDSNPEAIAVAKARLGIA